MEGVNLVIEVAIIRRQGLFLPGEFQVHCFPNTFQGSFVYTRAGNLPIYILLDALVTGGVRSSDQVQTRVGSNDGFARISDEAGWDLSMRT